MFKIIEVQPIYCQITDGLIGSRKKYVDGLVFHTLGWAKHKAHLLSKEEYANFGDGYFHAVDANEGFFKETLRLRGH